jgi:hypothetical protein
MIGTVDTNTVDPVSRVGNNPGRKGIERLVCASPTEIIGPCDRSLDLA